jgi:ADP-ribose pyrophosphatase YjhB (NUDIX family)
MKNRIIRAIDTVRRRTLSRLGGVTMGVRAIVFDSNGRYLLVRHTYREQWYTPGGGLTPGESPNKALRRELLEELSLDIGDSNPEIFHIFHSEFRRGFDYAIFYLVKAEESQVSICDKHEIADLGWFFPNSLPKDVSPRTAKLLKEVECGVVSDDRWL